MSGWHGELVRASSIAVLLIETKGYGQPVEPGAKWPREPDSIVICWINFVSLLRVERDPQIIYIGIFLGLKQTHKCVILYMYQVERDPWNFADWNRSMNFDRLKQIQWIVWTEAGPWIE